MLQSKEISEFFSSLFFLLVAIVALFFCTIEQVDSRLENLTSYKCAVYFV